MSATDADRFAHLDTPRVTREQWRIMFIPAWASSATPTTSSSSAWL